MDLTLLSDSFYLPLILTILSALIIFLDVIGKIKIRRNLAVIFIMWLPACILFVPKWIGGYVLLIFLYCRNVSEPLKIKADNTSDKNTLLKNETQKLLMYQITGSTVLAINIISCMTFLIAFLSEIATFTVGIVMMIIIGFLCPVIFLPLSVFGFMSGVMAIVVACIIGIMLIFVPYIIASVSGIISSVRYRISGGKTSEMIVNILFALIPVLSLFSGISCRNKYIGRDFDLKEKFVLVISVVPYAVIFILILVLKGMNK